MTQSAFMLGRIHKELQDYDGLPEGIAYRIERLKHFPQYAFDLLKLTRTATHGDYVISQLICDDQRIQAVIDWTTSCVHPVIWEIIRSYVYASPLCRNGQIVTADFIEYVKNYLQQARISTRMIRWFDGHIDEFTSELQATFSK